MKTIHAVSLIAVSLTACLLAGCGGGGNDTTTSPMLNGAVTFQMKWPTASAAAQGPVQPKLIPLDAKSIVITIKDGTTIVSGPTVLKAPETTVTISALPLKTLTAIVEAKVDPNGNGTAEAMASEPVTPTAGTPATATPLTLQSQIKTLSIATPNLSLFVGGTTFLSVTPKDALGQVVLVDPNTTKIQWTVSPGLTLAPASGVTVQLTGALQGSGTVSATYTDGAAATGDLAQATSNSVAVTVQPRLPGQPPNVPQYVNAAGLAIGPVGVGPGSFANLNDLALGSLYTVDQSNTGQNAAGQGPPGGSQLQRYLQNTTTGALTLDASFGTQGGVNVPSISRQSDAVDSQDNVYVASVPVSTSVIQKFNSTGSLVKSISPNSTVTGVTIGPSDNLFVALTGGSPLSVYNSSLGVVSSPAITLANSTVGGLAVDKSSNVYLIIQPPAGAFATPFRITKLKPKNGSDLTQGYAVDTTFGTGGSTVPSSSGLSPETTSRIAVDTRPGLPTTGNLYVTITSRNSVEVFDKNGVDDGQLPITGTTIQLNQPTGIAIDNRVNSATSGYLYIGNSATSTSIGSAVQILKPLP